MDEIRKWNNKCRYTYKGILKDEKNINNNFIHNAGL